jgi:hypothetical protein
MVGYLQTLAVIRVKVDEPDFSKLLDHWVDCKNDPADIVSKDWSYPQIWHLLKPLLFYSGNTQDLVDITEDNTSMDNKINESSQEASYHMFPTYNDNK